MLHLANLFTVSLDLQALILSEGSARFLSENVGSNGLLMYLILNFCFCYVYAFKNNILKASKKRKSKLYFNQMIKTLAETKICSVKQC
jgi:hypothetical protein